MGGWYTYKSHFGFKKIVLGSLKLLKITLSNIVGRLVKFDIFSPYFFELLDY